MHPNDLPAKVPVSFNMSTTFDPPSLRFSDILVWSPLKEEVLVV